MGTVRVEEAFQMANAHHNAGHLAEAEALYREVLAAQPGHAKAWHQLAVIACHIGQHELAVKLIGQVLRLEPNNAAAHFNLAGIYGAMEQFDQAIAAYQRALQIRPAFAEACNDLGSAFARQRRLPEAEAAFRRAVQLRPDWAMPYANWGHTLKDMGLADEAMAAYRKAIALKPDDAETCIRLGLMLEARGGLHEAAASYRQAMIASPDLAEAHNNLGNVLKKNGQLDAAAAAYRRTLELRPDVPEAHTNLGNVFRDQEHFADAIACYEQALALEPRFADAHLNWGVVHWLNGRYAEAEERFRQAIACRQNFPDAHLNLGLMLLLTGRYEEGWREYEWRWQCPSHAHRRRDFTAPQWDGRPVPGKTILIHAEQGFGDALQLVRYLPLILERAGGARLIFECRPEQVSLFQQFAGPRLEVIGRSAANEALPPFDLHLPLFSTPLALREFTPFSSTIPYLKADVGLRTGWCQRLCSGLRVGICWAGDSGHGHDHRRSIPPELLLPLLQIPEITFVSLQVSGEPLPAEFAEAGVLDVRGDIRDFSDSAALVAELDLIITVDTATAHLAGALGRPFWLLLAFVPDWRWGIGGEDSPWYPTTRLFRQSAPGRWDEVLQQVATDLRASLG